MKEFLINASIMSSRMVSFPLQADLSDGSKESGIDGDDQPKPPNRCNEVTYDVDRPANRTTRSRKKLSKLGQCPR